MQTFCVIPHSARSDPFFDGVYEDGVRTLHQSRLQSFLYSRVLSPAHDLNKLINGPLLDAIHVGLSAALIVALPALEDEPQRWSTLRNGSSSSSLRGGSKGEDGSRVALELYAHYLPLLFRSAVSCRTATISMATVSAHDRAMMDELAPGRPRVANRMQLRRLAVSRDASASQWGEVIQTLAARHEELLGRGYSGGAGGGTSSSSSNNDIARETACVVTVDLGEGYGTALLVDCGSDQDLLQALGLALQPSPLAPAHPLQALLEPIVKSAVKRSREATTLLSPSVSSGASVHVVCIPDPTAGNRNSMRVLRFAGDLTGTATPAAAAITSSSPFALHSEQDTSTASGKVAERTAHQAASSTSNAQGSSGSDLKTPASLPPPPPSRSVLSKRSGVEEHLMMRTAALERRLAEALADSAAARAAQRSEEQRTKTLEGQLAGKDRQLESLSHKCEAAEEELEEQLRVVIPALRKRVASLEKRKEVERVSENEQLEEAQATISALKSTIADLRSSATEQKRRSAAEWATKEAQLRRQLSEARQRSEQQRKRGASSDLAAASSSSSSASRSRSIPNAAAAGVSSLPSVASRTPRGHIYHPTDAGFTSPIVRMPAESDQESVIEELRAQNVKLAATIRELQRREAQRSEAVAEVVDDDDGGRKETQRDAALDSGGAPGACHEATAVCEECQRLKKEVTLYAEELKYQRHERSQLVDLLERVHASPSPTATKNECLSSDATDNKEESNVWVALTALLKGCVSLKAQLESIAVAAKQYESAHVGCGPITGRLVHEHVTAVEALVASLQDIGARRCPSFKRLSGSSTVVEGSTLTQCQVATTADCEALTSALTFELERVAHLRAFIPTFAQLAVAVEHMRMYIENASSFS